MFDTSSFTVIDDAEALKREEENAAALRMRESVMSPYYRPRSPIGGQEILGLIGSVAGGLAGAPVGPGGLLLGSTQGALAGGLAGELAEQALRKEPISPMDITKAGFEEAAWDLGGNLVLKGLGKTFRFGKDALGFSKNDVPDATKAAQQFLEKYGSSLPVSARTEDNIVKAIEKYTYTPITSGIFEAKQKEINDALMAGSQDILRSLVKSPEFDYAIRTNISSQRASGEVLQNFIKEGQDNLSKSVDNIYKDIFKDVDSKISTFSIKSWANNLLRQPASLTSGQRTILGEIKNFPNTLDISSLHNIRSRYLAENRDKYAAAVATEKDSRASGTITALIDKLDKAMDTAAKQLVSNERLSSETYKKYKDVTNTYREGIRGLQNDSITQALAKNPEEVGSYLFRAGNETPVLDLYKSVSAAGKLNKKPSKEVLDAMRYGYLESMISTPNGIMKLGEDLSVKGSKAKNTYDILMANTPQDKAIKDMIEASRLGNIDFRGASGVQLQSFTAAKQLIPPALAVASGYYFVLPPEKQQQIKDSFAGAVVAGGGLLLTQRQLAKAILDPRGARAVSYLSKGTDIALSPSGFTKLVVEPLYNILGPKTEQQKTQPRKVTDQFDTSNFSVIQE